MLISRDSYFANYLFHGDYHMYHAGSFEWFDSNLGDPFSDRDDSAPVSNAIGFLSSFMDPEITMVCILSGTNQTVEKFALHAHNASYFGLRFELMP